MILGIEIFAIDLPDEEVPFNGEHYQPQRLFLDDFVNQNIFAVGISDDEAVLNQGLGFTFETEQNLVELTNGFSRSVSDIPATYFLSALVGVPEDSEPPVGGLLGDFNNDGVVDAADYGTWQDNLGLDSSVLGGNGSGAATVVQADYELWRTHFGESIAVGLALRPVPEPATLLLALLALAAVPLCRFACGTGDLQRRGKRCSISRTAMHFCI
jgi:hypothetical protein